MKKANKLLILLLSSLSLSVVGCDNFSNVGDSSDQNSSSEATSNDVASSEVNSSISSSSNQEVSSNSSSSNEEAATDSSSAEPVVLIDYVSQAHLDLTDTSKIYQEVTVFRYVDGDTTHFQPKGSADNWINDEDGVLKARYNSCDTPESTGKVEPWGKVAKEFTHDALESAQSIIVQSDNDTWNLDSTGGRYLVWIWYRTSATEEYRLLNLELIQEGLAKLKSASSYSMYELFSAANNQAMTAKLKVYNPTEKAPGYYYGNAQSIDMKELRTNISDYLDQKVSVEGLITYYDAINHTVYAENYDAEDNKYYGMTFYLGYNSYSIIKAGNMLRFVGTVEFYETNGTYQVSGLTYMAMDPDYEGSMKVISKNNDVIAHRVTAIDLSDAKEEGQTWSNGDLIDSTYVKIANITVKDVYTTSSTNTASNGALTLTCEDSLGNQVIIRTSVLKKVDGTLVTKEDVLNKTIEATGIVTKYDGATQIHVYNLADLVIA